MSKKAGTFGSGYLFRDDLGYLWFWSKEACKIRMLDDDTIGGGYWCHSYSEAVEILIDGGYVKKVGNLTNEIHPNKWYPPSPQITCDKCPDCGSERVDWGSPDPLDEEIIRNHQCRACGTLFNEIYRLVEVEVPKYS
jgi:hypothetical protein